MSYNYAYLMYLCGSCQDWHARWHGYVTESGKIATALRLLGEAHQEAKAATDCGLLVLWAPEGHTGDALAIFDGGAGLTRAHRLTGLDLREIELRLDTQDVNDVVMQLASQGEETAFADDDWARVLRHLVYGNEDDDNGVETITPMDAETFRNLFKEM